MVAVIAPTRAQTAPVTQPLAGSTSPQLTAIESSLSKPNRYQSWLVPIAGVSAAVVVLATAVTLFVVLPTRSEPEDDDSSSPTIVNPLDPFGRNRDKPWDRPAANFQSGVYQPRPRADAVVSTGLHELSGPPSKPFRVGRPAPPDAGAANRDVGDPIQAVLRSVAVVAIPGEGHGSGFMAAPGILVTNHHVIEDAVIRDLRISFPDDDALAGRTFAAELMHASVPDDLAFLKIDADVQPLGIKAEYEHVNGQRVVAIGSPGSGGDGPTLENLTTDGRLGPEVILDDHVKRWALSMPVNDGNSGGPLVDAQTGEVMGVIVAKFTNTEAQSLAIPHASLVRELARATKASEAARAAALSLHRQRYCLRRMTDILGMTSFAFDRSVAAAVATSSAGAEGMDAAFNQCKALAAKAFAEQFADFSGNVGGEVADLQNDPDCDPRVRRGLQKLLHDIEEQAEEIRRLVPRAEITTFLGQFRGSVDSSRALVLALAGRLQIGTPEALEVD